MLEFGFWGYKDSEFRVQSFESGQIQTFTERPAPRQVDVPMAIYGNIPMITAVSRLEGLPWGGGLGFRIVLYNPLNPKPHALNPEPTSYLRYTGFLKDLYLRASFSSTLLRASSRFSCLWLGFRGLRV